MNYKQSGNSGVVPEYNILSASNRTSSSDDDDVDEIQCDIQSSVTDEFNKYPQMSNNQKYISLLYIQESIIENSEYKFSKNPFSSESLQILIDNTPLNVGNIKIIMQIANYICTKFPDDIEILLSLGYVDLIMKMTFDPFKSGIIIDVKTLEQDQKADNIIKDSDIIKDILLFELVIIGLQFFETAFPLFSEEDQNTFLSNQDYLNFILELFSKVNSNIEFRRELKYYQKEHGVQNKKSANSDLRKKLEFLEKHIIREILIFIQMICDIKIEAIAPIFLHVLENSEYAKQLFREHHVKIRYNKTYLYHMIQSYKITIKNKQLEVDESKDRQIQISLSSIILNVLTFDFSRFYEELDHCGFEDFLHFFLSNKLPLPYDCIKVFQLIITNLPPELLNKSTNKIYNTFKNIFDSCFETKYQVCLTFAKMSLANDISEETLEKIVDELNIFSYLWDCINSSSEEDCIVFLSSLNKLLNYKLAQSEKDEEFMKYMCEVSEELDSLDINRDNQEIDTLFLSISNLVPSDE